MNKLTTADCKKFLVAEITKNPDIIHTIFGDRTTAIAEALVARNWKREQKFNPTGNHDFVEPDYGRWNQNRIPATDLAAVRVFCLAPEQFEDAVRFNVLEDRQGQLHLGEYVGD